MSKSSNSYFCIHTGYFRNDRTLALREIIGDRAFFVMPMLWSWAGEQQMDGKVAHLTPKRYQEIFEGCHMKISLPEVEKIIAALKKTGFIQGGKLHSWEKFNRHCLEYEERQSLKRFAAFARWKEKVQADTPTSNAPEPDTEQPAKILTPSQRIWIIKEQIKIAKGKEKKQLEAKMAELLRSETGVGKDAPAPTRKPMTDVPEKPQEEIDREALSMARVCLKDTPEFLNESKVTLLYNAGDHLPPAVKKKFASVLEHRGEARNPVPG